MESGVRYVVYVKVNPSGYITDVNSDAFLADPTGWTEIDRGYSDRYHHAQGNYFSGTVLTDDGAYCYRLTNGIPVKCSAEEIAEQEASINHESSVKSQEYRIAELESQNELLMQCILELSEAVYC